MNYYLHFKRGISTKYLSLIGGLGHLSSAYLICWPILQLTDNLINYQRECLSGQRHIPSITDYELIKYLITARHQEQCHEDGLRRVFDEPIHPAPLGITWHCWEREPKTASPASDIYIFLYYIC